MASTTSLLNKPLRKYVASILRDNEFQYADARNAWRWEENCILVFNIRAVGNYFSQVTGWPPGSLNAGLGVFYTFGPQHPQVKIDDRGRLRPQVHLCHMRSHLQCSLDQVDHVRHLMNPAERARTDIWWVEPDGSNAEDVAIDIASSISGQAFSWFNECSNLERALAIVESTRDCFNKFSKAALLAYRIGDKQRWKKYDQLAEAEALRIGISTNREGWYGL